MKRARSARIVATLGPATEGEVAIRALFEAGVDVFRLNFSHGTQSDHAARLKIIRKLEVEFARPIGVLLDLQGPKLRLGTFASGAAQLNAGSKFCLDLNAAPGDARELHDLLGQGGEVVLLVPEGEPEHLEAPDEILGGVGHHGGAAELTSVAVSSGGRRCRDWSAGK